MKLIGNKDEKITVNLIADSGFIELIFPRPVSPHIAFWLFLALGHRRGNCLLVRGGKIVGVRCRPEDWESIVEKVAPETLQEFRSVVEDLRREAKSRFKQRYTS